jgi:hypothetical protein
MTLKIWFEKGKGMVRLLSSPNVANPFKAPLHASIGHFGDDNMV